ncbi:MAG: VOC family protein [Acidimicrobiia bacterium]|nr:VOC family protein [Acidimicrobiia bacterium]
MATKFQVTFDAADPAALSDFWAAALGYEVPPPPEGFDSWDAWARDMGIAEENWNDARALEDPDGPGPRLFFQKVPEAKTAKNRLHLDVNVSTRGTPLEDKRAEVRSAVDRLVGLGATEIEVFDQRDEHWIVMHDPEGNEFCVQ